MSQQNVRVVSSSELANNDEDVVVVLEISRVDIEAGNIAAALDTLLILSDTKENALLYRESLLLVVNGYNDDPRELAEITEVRNYFQRLVQEWPYFLWFLARGFGNIVLFLSMLCRVKFLRANGVADSILFEEKEDLREVLRDLLTRGNTLFVNYQIPLEDALESANSVTQDLEGWM